MRVSREQAEQNRQTVINTASRLFREHGFDGIGLKDLMKGAGLTQGGFYKQFDSKEDLIAQASQRAMEMATRRWSDVIAENPGGEIEAIIEFYLSADHRAEKRDGCPLAALGSDAARLSPEVKASFEAGVKAHLELLAELMPSDNSKGSYSGAFQMLSLMVGALTLARMINDESLASAFLDSAASEIRNNSKQEARA